MKILLLDIETAPSIAHVWGLWNENIPLDRLQESGYTLCWAAKWLGEEDIFYSSLHETGPKTMLKGIHKLLDQADAVIHYNGTRFDIPTLNKEFIIHGMPPPSPYKQIDLLKVCRTKFRFASNKMAFVSKELGIGEKGDTGGYKTWIGCMSGDPDSWETMKEYNIQDVLLLEKLYERLLPWTKGIAPINNGMVSCPNCQGTRLQRRGYAYTAAYKYVRFRCSDCGAWSRGTRSERSNGERVVGLGA